MRMKKKKKALGVRAEEEGRLRELVALNFESGDFAEVKGGTDSMQKKTLRERAEDAERKLADTRIELSWFYGVLAGGGIGLLILTTAAWIIIFG